MKKTTIIDRICDAWRALVGKPDPDLFIEIGMQRCDECFYYKKAHEPAETAEAAEPAETAEAAETASDAKKAPTWTDGPLPYYHEITYLDNVVLAVLYENTEDGPVELARAHGHIIHEGADGVAQAASYAMRLIWFKIHGGEQ
jgi:hypothetical protein